MRLLKERYYYVTWKADGTRYMLLILREGAYLIDRNFVFRRVQVRFPVAVSLSTP
jgi:mRNA-capping enzyme